MAESITEEDHEYLKEKYRGVSLQSILGDASAREDLDYILHTRKQRETLKRYGSKEHRAELALRAFVRLQAVLNMIQTIEVYLPEGLSGRKMIESLVAAHNGISHPSLQSPRAYNEASRAELRGFLDSLGLS